MSFLWVKRLTSSSFSYCLVLEFAHKSGYGVIMHFNISCFNIIFRKLLLQHLAFIFIILLPVKAAWSHDDDDDDDDFFFFFFFFFFLKEWNPTQIIV